MMGGAVSRIWPFLARAPGESGFHVLDQVSSPIYKRYIAARITTPIARIKPNTWRFESVSFQIQYPSITLRQSIRHPEVG